MKKKVLLLISFIISITILYGVMQAVGFTNIFHAFSNINIPYLFLYIFVSVCIFIGFVYRWHRILKSNGYHIPFRHLFMYRIAGYAVSYLTPSAKIGGEAVRGYLVRKNNMTASAAFTSVVVDKSIELTANIFYTIIGVTYLLFYIHLPLFIQYILIAILAPSIVAIGFFYYKTLSGGGFFSSIIRAVRLDRLQFVKCHMPELLEVEQKVSEFHHNNRREFGISFIISLAVWLLTLVEYQVLLHAFNIIDLSFREVYLILVLVGFSYLLPVPGATGVLQATEATLFRAIKKPASLGAAVGLIVQLRDILWTIIGLVYLYLQGFKHPLNQDDVVLDKDTGISIKSRTIFK